MKYANIKKIIIPCFLLAGISCEDFIQVDLPRTDLVKETVFMDDATAEAAMSDIYFQVGINGFAGGSINSVSVIAALSSDDLINGITFDDSYQQINNNEMVPSNFRVTALWQDMYTCIYKCNAILEGLAASDHVSESVRNQLNGEARFFRAFTHFYLVNLFGDIPLVLNTDYKMNQSIPRTSRQAVYEQIVADLLEARSLLSAGYPFSQNEKIRANKTASSALLARVYLYLEDWEHAESEASIVLDDVNYSLETDLKNVFLKNNLEAILQFYPSFGFPGDFSAFTSYGCLVTPSLLAEFEENDQRETNWISGEISFKYQSNTKYVEYSTVLRLAEQYLIRAEALTRQGKLDQAKTDINAVRTRAGLENTAANDQPSLLAAIEKERRVELFNEWGHRWFDLKRTNRIDQVLSVAKTGYQSTDALYAIPEVQIENDPAMKNAQNPGY
ncbi:MAG: RagB/SusD family nutrient uptake outer membrane protein [Marivirga sp.]|nr:RagB/SusD family nutrient uptake outer membrane protein [Marivirga sp.]